MRYQINKGLGASDPCVENFWSAACWFGDTGAKALQIDQAPVTMTPPIQPPSACAGTLNADGTCTMVGSVNDPNNTASTLPTNQQDFADQLAAWRKAVRDSAEGLTPGGCPPGQTGTYPDCVEPQGNTGLIVIGIAILATMFLTR